MDLISRFSLYDGIVLFSTVAVSVGIGIFFAYRSVSNVDHYFFANGKLKILPTTLSLVVTYQSSLLIIGVPAESYAYGLKFGYHVIAHLISYGFATFCVIPVFHPLKITSVYEYFELRYQDNTVRYLALTLGVVYLVFYMGSVTFGTCVALEVLIGIPYWGSILIYTIISATYTSIGGMKAVIWTDVFQMIIMATGVLAVIIKCVTTLGGMSELYHFGSSRFDMNAFSIDPTIRYTFWNMTFAQFSSNLVDCYNQPAIQRIRSIPTIKSARTVFALASIIKSVVTFSVCLEGVAIFAYYSYIECDPISSGRINTNNELIPLAISDLFSNVPGLSGLFLAALSSAALSTLSSCLSSLGAITYNDIIRVKYPNLSQKTATNISKAFVFLYGFVALGFAFLISALPGSIMKIFFALIACIEGPLCALFIVSTFSRRSTTKGVVIGTITGMIVTLVFNLGQIMIAVPSSDALPPPSVSGCFVGVNSTHTAISAVLNEQTTVWLTPELTTTGDITEKSFLQTLFSISFMFFSLIGFTVSLITSCIVSLCTSPSTRKVDDKCLFSFQKHVLEDMFGKVPIKRRTSEIEKYEKETTDLMSSL